MTELGVVAKTKDLATYIFTVTERSPKRFRFTLVSRMQNLCLDAIRFLYRANDAWLDDPAEACVRKKCQRETFSCLRELDYLLVLSRARGCLLARQQEHAAKLLSGVSGMLDAWMRSDAKRLAALRNQQKAP